MLVQGTILRNRYEIVAHLGSGGFADTYLARDRDLPNHPHCVVKHLKPTSLDPAILPISRRLFETEAQVLYLLGQHDKIPKLFAHFEENREFYLVQEFVDGYDLGKELTPGKRFSENEVVQLLQGILEVLVIVHQRNIIHRDIKPQNLIRRRIDGKIVLIDFGAVKEIGTLAMNTQGVVRSTIAIGTPGYMPNEQANRDPRLCSDVYATGMVAIQALTGLLPQQFLQDPTTGELIWSRYVQVNKKLEEVLNKMVRYHFSQRYQSASEALQAVNALPPQQQTSQPSSLSHRVARVISQIPRSLLWGGLIGLGGLAVGVFATVALLNRPQSPSLQPVAVQSQSSVASALPTSSSSTTPTASTQNVNWAIEPRFDGASGFSDGLAQVGIDGKWGYIDKNGTEVISPQFDETDDFSEGLARVWIAGQNWGYIDKTGKFVIPQQFTKDNASNFSEGLARACFVDTCGYINQRGDFVIERKYDRAGDFKEGLAVVKIRSKWGYIDKSGNVVIQPQFDDAGYFSEGLADIKIGEKWGYINKSGNVVIQPQFDYNYGFSEGLGLVKIGSKYGYIDTSGNLLVQPQFDDAYRFNEGLAGVKIGSKWGHIDKRGNLVVKAQFDQVNNFVEGLAVVKTNGKKGYIDKNGNFVIQPQFDKAGKFSEGLAWVTIGDKRGYIRNPLK
ncbi:MAG: WG repeat-containing protein [Iphinoe sp. HA4291-MV1]|jgi:serine/threonine protein kinase|nr:WG repeat-containing protein [Iphinoe sp. HA4291-MV1]